ncbi:UPF0158 family protein [Litoribacter populi]|uniref:UPF0158 family protein n=1 Tax=Litoribacter populi TaxID=2598460 RepID=UPI00117EEF4C|nr:UPF0158 family protein [Litoribacter populi]
MLSLTNPEKQKIAGYLIKGLICFYEIKTKKIYSLPDDEDHFSYDLTPEEEDILDEIEDNPDNYVEFVKMEPYHESLIMEEFADRQVKERSMQEDLFNALAKPKATSSFRVVVESSQQYKAKWNEYLLSKYLDWVQEQLDSHNIMEN